MWFPAIDIPVREGRTARLPVLVGVAGYPRWIVGQMIPSRERHDLLSGHLACLVDLGRVPRAGVYDNEGAIGRWRPEGPRLTRDFQAFRGALGMGVILSKPADPEAKGLIERANRYLETFFLPGRSFTSLAHFNAQLGTWLELANSRHHRTIDCRPIDRIAEDRAAMLALPPVLPDPALPHLAAAATRPLRARARLGLLGGALGDRPPVDVRADLDTVTVHCTGTLIASHARSLARHLVVTDPGHVIARAPPAR